MNFELNKSIEILERTPEVIEVLLSGLSQEWVRSNEGDHTWSPYDIVGHLIFGEKTDWILRIKTILSESDNKLFEPFDRFAQLKENQEKSIDELIIEFKEVRIENLNRLKSLNIKQEDLNRTGIHPEFGEVNLKQLISTWAVHDLGHIAQISRVMAKQYKSEVGPWINYLGILNK
ncbi:DinB family protein [Ichthyenterobacterium sp. W332]|uniref:DinB family protein n=1 Tax=Microcosmobacter mediterraneus TaxID=3075607 RepID=A0ABU2YN25_9FLAO|nr:DinB family protein [Ichthyenterobacterium sp. W332]MDT0559554.1 DinB family protein [Ichthyenterobacterium sp. W332]